jgi:NAD(P)-dependent dehydrogenase (short-subunit alcohol dehydrogenase family)
VIEVQARATFVLPAAELIASRVTWGTLGRTTKAEPEASMTDLQGKRIVLTGASRGVGYHSTKMLLAAGAKVFGIARNEARLKKAAEEFRSLGQFLPFVADWADSDAPRRAAEAVAAEWPAVDVLINNAAVQMWKPGWHAEGLETFHAHFRINVAAQHEFIYHLTPLLKAGVEPRVINVSSGAGKFDVLRESADGATYKFTKFALNGLTLLWAQDLKGQVSVNSFDPGWLKTDMGGPNAPGEPEDGGRRVMECLSLPWEITGRFWYGKEEIPF